MLEEIYTKNFYDRLRIGATRSAQAMVPLVLQLLPVRSVVDIGCGDGSWLAVFRERGVDDVLGVDGEHVDREILQIPQSCFKAADLAKPLDLRRVFDLAVSLEVAEHLPLESAPVLVESLTRLAPLVLFSAAIPFQGGTRHINEQWQDWWAALFKKHGYLPVDFIRRRIWQDDSVEWWYAQNTLLYARAAQIECNASLKAEFEKTDPGQLRLVHPKQYLCLHDAYSHLVELAEQPALRLGIRMTSRLLPASFRHAFRRRLDLVLWRLAPSLKDPPPATPPMKT